MSDLLGPATGAAIGDLARRGARRRRLLDASASAAFMIALDVQSAEALLLGRPVPRHRLDPHLADVLGVGEGELILTLDGVEQIMLAGPAPVREFVCARCRRRAGAPSA